MRCAHFLYLLFLHHLIANWYVLHFCASSALFLLRPRLRLPAAGVDSWCLLYFVLLTLLRDLDQTPLPPSSSCCCTCAARPLFSSHTQKFSFEDIILQHQIPHIRAPCEGSYSWFPKHILPLKKTLIVWWWRQGEIGFDSRDESLEPCRQKTGKFPTNWNRSQNIFPILR